MTLFIGLMFLIFIAPFIIAVYFVWKKITKPHIQAMMKVDQQILQQPTYYQNNSQSNNFSEREMKLINIYRKLSESNKQKLSDYAETLVRRDNYNELYK